MINQSQLSLQKTVVSDQYCASQLINSLSKTIVEEAIDQRSGKRSGVSFENLLIIYQWLKDVSEKNPLDPKPGIREAGIREE